MDEDKKRTVSPGAGKKIQESPKEEAAAEDSKEIIRLLRKNLEHSRRIMENTEKMRLHIMWRRVFFIVKIFLVAIPLILAFVYLPPFLEEAWQYTKPYRDIFNGILGDGL